LSHGVDPAPERIVLVGFMAAGKSTVGRILADRLGWELVDFDDAIRRRTGRSPGELIRAEGEAAFRALEAEVTAELASREKVVLAPGGGWLTEPGPAASLGDGTVTVWLRVSPAEAVRRAESDGTDRPLMGPPEGRVDRVARLLRDREPLYETADLVVDVDDEEPARIAETILARLRLTTGG
jgi:shikimate kinase